MEGIAVGDGDALLVLLIGHVYAIECRAASGRNHLEYMSSRGQKRQKRDLITLIGSSQRPFLRLTQAGAVEQIRHNPRLFAEPDCTHETLRRGVEGCNHALCRLGYYVPFPGPPDRPARSTILAPADLGPVEELAAPHRETAAAFAPIGNPSTAKGNVKHGDQTPGGIWVSCPLSISRPDPTSGLPYFPSIAS